MRLAALIASVVTVLTSAPASAEIVSRTADGFVLHHAVAIETTPEDFTAAVAAVPDWWDPAHTYTGDAANLSLAFEPGGCWCERLENGTVFHHATVTAIAPNRVALDAPLGPLHASATRAELVFSATPVDGGWTVAMDFAVEGPGLGAVADGVETVIGQAFERFIHQVEYGEPPVED